MVQKWYNWKHIQNVYWNIFSLLVKKCNWKKKSSNISIAYQFWSLRQNLMFDICKWHQWRQSCQGSVAFAWAGCLVPVWLDDDTIMKDSPTWLCYWVKTSLHGCAAGWEFPGQLCFPKVTMVSEVAWRFLTQLLSCAKTHVGQNVKCLLLLSKPYLETFDRFY
jgi:hypothetical protein